MDSTESLESIYYRSQHPKNEKSVCIQKIYLCCGILSIEELLQTRRCHLIFEILLENHIRGSQSDLNILVREVSNRGMIYIKFLNSAGLQLHYSDEISHQIITLVTGKFRAYTLLTKRWKFLDQNRLYSTHMFFVRHLSENCFPYVLFALPLFT